MAMTGSLNRHARGAWRSIATTAGESRCPRDTSSRSPSTAAARARAGARDRAASPTPCRGSGSRPCTTRISSDRIRTGQMTVREQRGLGLPWSRGARRARPAVGRRDARRGAAGAAARGRDEPRRRHPPRGPRLRPRLLPVQRRRGDAGAAALGRADPARRRRRLRRPPGRRHGPDPRSGSRRLHAVAARRPQLPVRAHPVRPRRRPRVRHRRRRLPGRARATRSTSRSGAASTTSPSTSRAPTHGRATASAASR